MEHKHENQTWRVVDYYKLKHRYAKCMVCGKPNIVHVFVVKNVETKKKMTVGNVCINKISNSEIADWYINIKIRLETLETNKSFIDVTYKILQLHRQRKLAIFISRKGIERLEKMLDRMCKGINPRKSQKKLLQYYFKKLRKEAGYET